MIEIRCLNCHQTYPEVRTPYRCLTCGGIYHITSLPVYDSRQLENQLPGIWRYKHTFNLPPESPIVSLGEGGTNLIWKDIHGRKVGFKLENLNPSGSFKDRGAAVLVSFLLSRGVTWAVEDSSGNAGASFAAYAAQAGLNAQVFIPEYASGPKRTQILSYGAKVISVPGPRSKTSAAILNVVESNQAENPAYASHAYLPHGILGYATIAYEIFEQMDGIPEMVIVPAGQGNLLLGIGLGFRVLKESGSIHQLPKLVGVQAMACAPLWAVFHHGVQSLAQVTEGETRAEGVRIRNPLRGDAVLQIVSDSQGTFVAVEEKEIPISLERLKQLGFFVEPTSAITWNALMQVIKKVAGPIVVILTGAGFRVNHISGDGDAASRSTV